MRVALFQVLASLMVLSSLVGCGGDDDGGGGSCPQVPSNIADGEACFDFCDARGFDTAAEQNSGCVVSCECSGGSGTAIASADDCFFYCDSFEAYDDYVMASNNTCICDRSAPPPE